MVIAPTIPDGTGPEAEMLLRLARIDPAGRGVVAISPREPDAGHLLAYALRHRLSTQLYEGVVAVGAEQFPEELVTQLHATVEAIARNNLMLTSELLNIVRAFGRAGVRVLPLKGPLLAERLHGNIARRAFNDLDILVRPRDVRPATDVLVSLGYEGRPSLNPTQEEKFLRDEYDRSFVHCASGSHIELHWRPFDRGIAFALPEEELWASLEERTFLGATVLDLPAEHLLLYLAVHGAKHGWAQLGWSFDVACLVARERALDWKRLATLAERLGCRRAVAIALRLAGSLWGITVPDEAWREIDRDRRAVAAAQAIVAALVIEERAVDGDADSYRTYLASRERLGDRLHYAWAWLTSPNRRDRAFIDLPAAFSFLYLLVRPVRIARDRLRRVG